MTDKILQVITDTDRRGAQVFAVDLGIALSRQGRTVNTLALTRGTSGGLDVPTLGRGRLGPATLRALRHEIAAADVVIGHGSTTLPACGMASMGAGTPFLYRQISDSRFWASTRLRRTRVRAGLRRATRVIALWSGSADTLHEYLGVPRERLAVVPNGVPPERFPIIEKASAPAARLALGLEPDRPTVAYLGALVPEKGVDIAIEAIAGVPTAQLLVAGAGPERTALELMASSRVPGRVHFVGSLSRSAEAFAAADVVVLPSRGGDSMPAVLIEAGMSGLPTISTPVEGIPEIVIDGVTGFLTAIDSPVALRGAISRVLNDTDFAATLGHAAQAHCAEHFSIDRVATLWAAVIDGVVKA